MVIPASKPPSGGGEAHGAPSASQSSNVVLTDGGNVLPRGMAPDETASPMTVALSWTFQHVDH
jgi:hypothetical protein